MMRIVSRLVWVSVIIISLAGISTAKINPQNVVGLWLLDEGTGTTVTDSSEQGFNGEIIGDVKWTTEGKFGNALSFPGNPSSYVTIPHDDAMNLVTMTLTTWVKLPELPESVAMIYKVEPSNVRNYALRSWTTGVFAFEFTVGPGNYHNAESKAIIVDDKWHHVAGTYDKKAIRVYVDGVLDSETSFNEPPDTTPGPILLGARSLKGILDDVGIFNVALNQAEIQDIMERGLKGVSAVSPGRKLATVWGELKVAIPH